MCVHLHKTRAHLPCATAIVDDPTIDIVVEVMGTMEEAREVVFKALKR